MKSLQWPLKTFDTYLERPKNFWTFNIIYIVSSEFYRNMVSIGIKSFTVANDTPLNLQKEYILTITYIIYNLIIPKELLQPTH